MVKTGQQKNVKADRATTFERKSKKNKL